MTTGAQNIHKSRVAVWITPTSIQWQRGTALTPVVQTEKLCVCRYARCAPLHLWSSLRSTQRPTYSWSSLWSSSDKLPSPAKTKTRRGQQVRWNHFDMCVLKHIHIPHCTFSAIARYGLRRGWTLLFSQSCSPWTQPLANYHKIRYYKTLTISGHSWRTNLIFY